MKGCKTVNTKKRDLEWILQSTQNAMAWIKQNDPLWCEEFGKDYFEGMNQKEIWDHLLFTVINIYFSTEEWEHCFFDWIPESMKEVFNGIN